MSDANFLNDLSSGIFSRLGELRQQQHQEDDTYNPRVRVYGEALEHFGSNL